MRRTWRRWLPGRRFGIARGVAVFRARGREHAEDREAVARSLARCGRLRSWADAHDVVLDNSIASLAELDRQLGAEEHPDLDMDLGLYLGTVIVTNVRSAQWHAWPNGHPVVRVRRGRTLDLTALVTDGQSHGGITLTGIYEHAASRFS